MISLSLFAAAIPPLIITYACCPSLGQALGVPEALMGQLSLVMAVGHSGQACYAASNERGKP